MVAYLQQYRSSWPQGQSITPSQMWFADIHLFSPQCKGDLETVFFARMGFFTILVVKTEEDEEEEEEAAHSPHPISSLWSSQSKWPSHRQSTGMHLVPSHWNPLVHTVHNTFTKKRGIVTSIVFFFFFFLPTQCTLASFLYFISLFSFISIPFFFFFICFLSIFCSKFSNCSTNARKKKEKNREWQMGFDSGSIVNPLCYYCSFRSFSTHFCLVIINTRMLILNQALRGILISYE